MVYSCVDCAISVLSKVSVELAYARELTAGKSTGIQEGLMHSDPAQTVWIMLVVCQ